jgi:hypothetical protein
MNDDGNYFLWSGIGAVEIIEDAEPLTATPEKALAALKAKSDGHWTLWLRQGLRAVLVAVWIPRREELSTIPIDVSELDGEGFPP